MALPLPHNKYVLIGIVGAAILLGLYLRKRASSTDSTASSTTQDPLSNLDASAYDPTSGTFDATGAGGGGGSFGNGDSNYPYPAGGPPIVIKLLPPKKTPVGTTKRKIYGYGKNGKPFYSLEEWNKHKAERNKHAGGGKHGPVKTGVGNGKQYPH